MNLRRWIGQNEKHRIQRFDPSGSLVAFRLVCMCVCLRPPFLDKHWSDLIETCQEYCWGPEDVPFQGLKLIGQAVPTLGPFIYQPMTGHGAMTSRVSSQSQFFFSFLSFFWYVTIDAVDLSMCLFKVWYRSSSSVSAFARAKEWPVRLFLARGLKCFFFFFFFARTGTH